MPTVDSKGRVVIPTGIRERLGIGPGTQVEIYEAGGKAIVEPETDPDAIIERMEELVEASERGETLPMSDDSGPIARKHSDAVRRGTETSDT